MQTQKKCGETMRTIAILTECNEAEKALLLSAGGKDDKFLFFPSDAALLACGQQADVIFGEPDLATISNLPNLRWVQMTWAGANKYTGAPGFPEHVKLTSASGAFGGVISEHILAGILALYKNLRAYQTQLKQGLWEPILGDDTLEGKRALILGTGDIGSHTAKKLKAFGATTIGICRVKKKTPECFDECYTTCALDAELPNADLVIIALPGTKQTRHLMNAERIGKMKSSALLVNVGRGFVLDTDALTQALESGKIRGAVLDVTDPEPLPEGHKLRHMDNVILTPHVSGVSWGENQFTRQKIIGIFLENLQKDAVKAPLNHQIDLAQGY